MKKEKNEFVETIKVAVTLLAAMAAAFAVAGLIGAVAIPTIVALFKATSALFGLGG